MAEERKEPKVEGGLNVNIGGFNLGNLLGGVFGNIEELLNAAERLANTKGDERAKENVRKMREGLGKTGATGEDIKTKGLGGLFSQILNFAEKTGGQEETKEFEIGGKKGVISRGIRIGGLSGPGRQPSEKFEVRHHKPRTQRTKEKPVVEERAQEPALDVFEEESHIKIVGDMSGVNEEDIKHELQGKTIRIYTETGRKYEKEVELPASVAKKVDLKYQNGVLEITLTKRRTKKSKKES